MGGFDGSNFLFSDVSPARRWLIDPLIATISDREIKK